MTIDDNIETLINAEIDGEISADDRALLERHLAENPDARAYRDALVSAVERLEALESLDPPPDIKNAVMRELGPAPTAHGKAITGGGIFSNLFGIPTVRYGLSFAAGVILTLTLFSSDQASRQTFDDVTTLVGTMGDASPDVISADQMRLTLNELAGSVRLGSAGPLLILDFDLTSSGPVEIIASFGNQDIWFNGFAQLESQGTSVAAGFGQVTLRMEGQRRYAVYLNNAGSDAATVNLQFIAGGEVLHEGALTFAETN